MFVQFDETHVWRQKQVSKELIDKTRSIQLYIFNEIIYYHWDHHPIFVTLERMKTLKWKRKKRAKNQLWQRPVNRSNINKRKLTTERNEMKLKRIKKTQIQTHTE